MTLDEAREAAVKRAQQPLWAEDHITQNQDARKPCSCSLCYWRHVHVQKLLDGRATAPPPEYDWPALEEADHLSRQRRSR